MTLGLTLGFWYDRFSNYYCIFYVSFSNYWL